MIGVAGDRISIVEGLVYVAGEALSESYVPQQYVDRRSQPEIRQVPKFRVNFASAFHRNRPVEGFLHGVSLSCALVFARIERKPYKETP